MNKNKLSSKQLGNLLESNYSRENRGYAASPTYLQTLNLDAKIPAYYPSPSAQEGNRRLYTPADKPPTKKGGAKRRATRRRKSRRN